MAVGVRGHGEVPLPDVLADPRPGDATQVQEADSPVAEVVWRERRHARGAARPRDRGAEAVGAEPEEDAPRSREGQESPTPESRLGRGTRISFLSRRTGGVSALEILG